MYSSIQNIIYLDNEFFMECDSSDEAIEMVHILEGTD